MAIEASGLLISWATPAARKPTLASCSLRTTCLVRSCTCRSRSSRMAWKRAVMSFMASASSDISSCVLQHDAIAELAGRHAPRTFDQHPQRPKDPGVEQPDEDHDQQHRRDRRDPGQHDPGVILRMDFALELLDAPVEDGRAIRRPAFCSRLQLGVERFGLPIVVDPARRRRRPRRWPPGTRRSG